MRLGKAFCCALVVLLLLGVGHAVSQAAVVEFWLPAGATADGHPVEVKATFTTSADQVDILLENLTEDPISVGQNISGLFFELSTGESAGALTSSSSVPRKTTPT